MDSILVFNERKLYDPNFFHWPQMLCMHWEQDWACNLYLKMCTPGYHAACQLSTA